MRRLSLLWAALLLSSAALSAQTTIYWKKDHIYGTPGGGRIATAVPEPADTTVPSTPTNLQYSGVTATTVTLTWSGSTDSGGSGLAGYKVYRGPIPVGTTTNTTFTDEGLVPETGYAYTVRAFDTDQNHSAASGSVSPTTTTSSGDSIDPSIPDGLSGTSPEDDTIELWWNASTDQGGSGVAGYKVYRDTSLVSGGTPITPTSFTDTGLDPYTEYTYEVRAVDGQGNESDDSDPFEIYTRGTIVIEDDFNRADAATLTGNGWTHFIFENWGPFSLAAHKAIAPISEYWQWRDSVSTSSVSSFYAAADVYDDLNDTRWPGFIFWDTGEGDTHYRVTFSKSGANHYVHLRYFADVTTDPTGTWVTSGLLSSPPAPARLEVVADSSSRNIKVYVNGVEEINYTDTDTSRPNSGRTGITAYMSPYEAYGTAVFDNFILETR